METSSGQLRSRPIPFPSKPLTDKRIKAYILSGHYGPALQAKELAAQAKKQRASKKPNRKKALSHIKQMQIAAQALKEFL